jgi:hypothetical protein
MDSIQRRPDRRVLTYLKYCSFRNSRLSDERIAKELFGLDSPEPMYMRLRRDGFPVCIKCGDYSPELGHCPEKRPQISESAEEIPMAKAAVPLFRNALAKLSRDVENLEARHEVIRSKRFEALNMDPASVFVLQRDDVSSEGEWRDLCEKAGQDPALTKSLSFTNVIARRALGVREAPPEPLTALIAVYALAGELLEPLVEALHVPSKPPDWKAIEKRIEGEEGLRHRAQQLAREVRGIRVGRGAPAPELNPEQQEAVYYITQLRESGASEKEIEDVLRLRGFDKKTAAWLSDLRCKPPRHRLT